jgi:hypothetical protein
VSQCKKVGATSEASGILAELDLCGKATGPIGMTPGVLLILIDTGVVKQTPGLEFLFFNCYMGIQVIFVSL